MRLLTWNINGVRTIPQYHPWNTLKTHDDILMHLGADIICFQEMKSSRPALPKAVAVPPSFHAFFSFPLKKSGYSGVATYTRHAAVIPLKAEEGITGTLPPPKPSTSEERVSQSEAYPQRVLLDADTDAPLDYHDIDGEGRALVLDFKLFVLINVYCPNDGTGTPERERYKADFHTALAARVKGLVGEGREVIVMGDLNACAAVEDHCEGALMVERGRAEGMQGEDGFWGAGARRWLREWIDAGMADVVREFWPDRRGMYTCWNTKISARESNYGTRIDYILATRGLRPWIKATDIQPDIKGSDHCPVYVDFHDEITTPDGHILTLRDAMGYAPGREPPRLAAQHWDEHSGKQLLLDRFFGGGSKSGPVVPQAPATAAIVVETVESTADVSPPPTPVPATIAPAPLTRSASGTIPSSTPSSSQKRKITATDTRTPKKLKPQAAPDKRAGQSKLSSFFAKPQASQGSTPTSDKSKSKSPPTIIIDDDDNSTEPTVVDEEADYRLALALSQESTPSPTADAGESIKAWGQLLAPLQPPRCTAHGEPAKEMTVNKPGPNRGKHFFICARPVGPGYDLGKERMREQVDHRWKCDFFKWASDVRREMGRKAPG